MKTITLGFSPCPNDTFIFDALVNGRIKQDFFEFRSLLADVEQLNILAMEGTLQVTKISIGAYSEVSERYQILNSGSALGRGAGPILVSKRKLDKSNLEVLKVAIPGKHTTANLLLSVFYPEIKNKVEVVFSDIENAVLSGRCDAGLLIHEGRFTFEKKGLLKIFDLGEVWEEKMNLPLPLGCIAVSRKLRDEEKKQINSLIKQSIEYAYDFPDEGKNYISENAREMEPSVIEKHINLYVNKFSIDLGLEGKSAIEFLLQNGFQSGLLQPYTKPVFV